MLIVPLHSMEGSNFRNYYHFRIEFDWGEHRHWEKDPKEKLQSMEWVSLRDPSSSTFGKIEDFSFGWSCETLPSSLSFRPTSSNNCEVLFTWYRVRLPNKPSQIKNQCSTIQYYDSIAVFLSYRLDWCLNLRVAQLDSELDLLVSNCKNIGMHRRFR